MGNIILRAFGVDREQEEEEESRFIQVRLFVILLLAYLLAWINEWIETQTLTHYDSDDEDHVD